jgi:hypothetical protein
MSFYIHRLRGFEGALVGIKGHERWRRSGWRKGSYVYLEYGLRGQYESFIAVHTHDGRFAPWTPSRCDLLERDWEEVTP